MMSLKQTQHLIVARHGDVGVPARFRGPPETPYILRQKQELLPQEASGDSSKTFFDRLFYRLLMEGALAFVSKFRMSQVHPERVPRSVCA